MSIISRQHPDIALGDVLSNGGQSPPYFTTQPRLGMSSELPEVESRHNRIQRLSDQFNKFAVNQLLQRRASLKVQRTVGLDETSCYDVLGDDGGSEITRRIVHSFGRANCQVNPV